eukprot:NODE_9879_length_502_cov_46.466667_g9856_i0.p1 GENE.NODE_9879_length_502_cov_46.466667_g9856_i0~~NODE_9879_length_502_cov_46.466667_g9856_i0.p1  ORF type:complete len:152 (-),score=14.26 NODE_9879_length_502_cov_46.466667_g9856_i0:46-465(-)
MPNLHMGSNNETPPPRRPSYAPNPTGSILSGERSGTPTITTGIVPSIRLPDDTPDSPTSPRSPPRPILHDQQRRCSDPARRRASLPTASALKKRVDIATGDASTLHKQLSKTPLPRAHSDRVLTHDNSLDRSMQGDKEE